MQPRTYRVPFSAIPDVTELEFGSDDYLVIRPLGSRSSAVYADIAARAQAVSTDDETASAAVYMELLNLTIAEWHLAGPDGPIPMPATWDDVEALPQALAVPLIGFLFKYRGDGPNPTTGGLPS
jgi:hypothetical protein